MATRRVTDGSRGRIGWDVKSAATILMAAGLLALAPPAMAAAVKPFSSDYGEVIGDGRGHVLYLFTRDRAERSRCYGACARAWPPFTTRGRPRVRGGLDPDLIGTVRRRRGKRQVTYDGHPLYYYVGDRRPGQIFCQDVREFGGRWLIVAPSGDAVR